MAATEDPRTNLYKQASFYESPVDLAVHIKPGDHIAVQTPRVTHWHHGIYIGEFTLTSGTRAAVVDMWGESKETATVRALADFVSGAVRLAKIRYAKGTVRSRDDTVALALQLEKHAASNNCEHFAVLCRSRLDAQGARCAWRHLERELARVDAPMVAQSAGAYGKRLL